MVIQLAPFTVPILLSMSLMLACLLTAYTLYRWAFKPKPSMTAQVVASGSDASPAVVSSLLVSPPHAPSTSDALSLPRTAPQPSALPSTIPNQHTNTVDTIDDAAFVHRFWQFTAGCVIGKSLTHRQTRATLRNRDPENLLILDKWAARDLFNFVPVRTQTQMMYAEDGNLIAERPDGLPCSGQNNIVPMLCLSQQALCALIFHISEKKFYTVDPSHTYHGTESSGYFTNSEGFNTQTEIQQELHHLTGNHTIDLASFTHVELSPKTALAFSEFAVYNFLCQAMCLALSYEFNDRTLNPSPEDFGDLLANTFVNTQDSYHSRHATLSHLQEHNQLFSKPVNAKPNSKKHPPNQNNAPDPRSVTFSEVNDLCYFTDCHP